MATQPIVQTSFLDTPQVEIFMHRGYEQRVSYDLEHGRWRCLVCVPSFFPPWNDFHYWHYSTDKDDLVERVKADIDAEMDCVSIPDKPAWDAALSAKELTMQGWRAARYPDLEATA